ATTVTVAVGSTSDSAAEGTDYATVSDLTLTIAAGAASASGSFTLTPDNDVLDETDETISVDGTAGTLTVTDAAITITDDDAAPTVSLALSPASISEDGGVSTVTASLSGASSAAVTLTVSAAAVSPAVAGDFTLSSATTLTIAAGATASTGTVTITAVDNDVDAPDKEVTVSATVGGGVSNTASKTLTIRDDDNLRMVSLSAMPNPVAEGAAVTVTARVSTPLQQDVTVPLTLTDGTAEADDYGSLASITVVAGSTVGTGTIATHQDADSHDETFTVSLGGSLPSSVAAGSPSSIEITIADDDLPMVSLSAMPNPVAEGAAVTVTARVSTPLQQDVMVPLVLTDGTAEADDYGPLASITVVAGSTTGTGTVATHQDADSHDETFTVSLGGSLPSSVAAGSPSSIEITIADDDPVPPTTLTLSVTDTAVAENAGTVAVTATLDQPAGEGGVAVTLAAAEASTAAADDYALPEAFTLAAGVRSATVTVTIVDDAVDEEDEVLALTATAADGLVVTGVTLTLADDDTAGVTVGAAVLEVDAGKVATYTLVLESEPTADVTVTPVSDDPETAAVSPASLMFTPANWNVAQEVTVAGKVAGDAKIAHAAASADPKYADGLAIDPVAVTVNAVVDRPRQAWLARFGRTAGSHMAAAVGERLSEPAAKTARLGLDGDGSSEPSVWVAQALQSLGGGDGADGRRRLANGTFEMPLASGWRAWGRGAYTRFEGEEEALRLDGEVRTGTLGLDRADGHWRWGLALSHSEGDGEAHGEDGRHRFESRLSVVHPYARWRMRDGLSAWGMLGWGEGELDSRAGDGAAQADLQMRMAAFGAEGPLGTVGAFALSLKSDLLAVRLEADADADHPAVEADAQRLRLRLAGAGVHALETGGTLSPTLDAGLRWDGGDAETGLGAEVGAGVGFAGAGGRLDAEFSMRALLAHEQDGYREWGVGGVVRLRPDADGRGPSLRLESWRGAVAARTEELWNRPDLGGLGDTAVEAAARFAVELGYGLNGPGRRGTLTPYAGYEHRDSTARWRLGARLERGDRLHLCIEGIGGDSPALEVRITLRW
ncbi:MAG: hypothetical protein OXC38_01690, partial [Gammaproteobacteria bacterium]|nr:hypothetical protein [Gammaproteobacteria bacterium]